MNKLPRAAGVVAGLLITLVALSACNISPRVSATASSGDAATAPPLQDTAAAAAVKATQQAVAASLPRSPQVDPAALSRQELAARIDQAVARVLDSAGSATRSTSSALTDGALTQAEVDALAVEVLTARQALATAYALTNPFFNLHADQAGGALDVLNDMEFDLDVLDASVQTAVQALADVAVSLQQGQTPEPAAIEALRRAADAVSQAMPAVERRQDEWHNIVQAGLD